MDYDYEQMLGEEGIGASYLNPDIKQEDGFLTRMFDQYQHVINVDGVDFNKLIDDVQNNNYRTKAFHVDFALNDCYERSKGMLSDKTVYLYSIGASQAQGYALNDMWCESVDLLLTVRESFTPAMDAMDELEKKTKELAEWQAKYDELLAKEKELNEPWPRGRRGGWKEKATSLLHQRREIHYIHIIPLQNAIKKLLEEIAAYEQRVIEGTNRALSFENYIPG